MKKVCFWTALSVAIFSLLLVTACGGNSNPTGNNGKPGNGGGEDDTTIKNPVHPLHGYWLYKDDPNNGYLYIRPRRGFHEQIDSMFFGDNIGVLGHTYEIKDDTLHHVRQRISSQHCNDSTISEQYVHYRINGDTLFLDFVYRLVHELVSGQCDGQERGWIYADEPYYIEPRKIDTLFRSNVSF